MVEAETVELAELVLGDERIRRYAASDDPLGPVVGAVDLRRLPGSARITGLAIGMWEITGQWAAAGWSWRSGTWGLTKGAAAHD